MALYSLRLVYLTEMMKELKHRLTITFTYRLTITFADSFLFSLQSTVPDNKSEGPIVVWHVSFISRAHNEDV